MTTLIFINIYSAKDSCITFLGIAYIYVCVYIYTWVYIYTRVCLIMISQLDYLKIYRTGLVKSLIL